MARFKTLNPRTGEVLAEVEVTPPDMLEAIVRRAVRAQETWAQTPLSRRIPLFRALLDRVVTEARDIAELVSREEGKPVKEALLTEVLPAAEGVRYLLRRGPAVLRPRKIPHFVPLFRDRDARLELRPSGVWGVIAPWNYPFAIPFLQIATAVFAGNAAVLKPSPLTPLVGERVGRLFQEAGFPEDLVAVVQGGASVGEALVHHGEIRGILFTGSVATGRRVAELAAGTPKKVVLELGGNDPALVFGDVDPVLAGKGIIWSAMTNAGQTCAAVERVYVERSISLELFDVLTEEARRIRPGEDMGPLVAEFQLQKVEGHVEDARSKGARVAAGGRRREDLGPLFYEPTVLLYADHAMQVMQEETFGPVVAVQVVDSEEEAVRLANATPFGLTASVWTGNPRRARRVAARLEAGVVTVNSHTYTFAEPEFPWGGVKASGVGRTHGVWGLLEVTEPVVVDARFPIRPEAWWYPYPDFLDRLFLGYLELLRTPRPHRTLRAFAFLPYLGFLRRRIPLGAFLRWLVGEE